MNLIPYSKQSIDTSDINAVVDILRSDWITQGPAIERFEKTLADYCGARYSVTFNSGTSALHAAYFVAGLKEGDEFITSPLSFVATSNAGLYLGARPVFTDIESDTGNIAVSKIEAQITERTKLIVPVHYSGHPADMYNIHQIAKKNDLCMIEDACHALGARYKNEVIGNCKYADMTVFSFHPVKHITTGEGGAVTTNNEEYYEKLLMFRSHGITKKNFIHDSDGEWYYEMHYLGHNYRMTDIQAALGMSQMNKLNSFVEKRRTIAETYRLEFNDSPYFDLPTERDYACSSYHLYPIRLRDRYKDKKKELFSTLRNRGLGIQCHYIPIYWQPYYQELGYKKGLCPEAENFYRREISIPVYPAMTNSTIDETISIIFNSFKQLET